METIDRDEGLAIKTVIGPITDRSAVEQPLPFHAEVKRLFLYLVRAPHSYGIFGVHCELQRLLQRKVSPDGDRTFIPFRNNAAAEAIENAEMRISIEIVRQPADCKCFKIPALESPSSQPRSKAGLLAER